MAIGDKPAKLPEWASDGGADIEEPSESKKDIGWLRERPPHQWFNWFWNLVYQWIAWTKEYGETHVHSGGSGDFQAPKIEFENHIRYGNNGQVSVPTDSSSLYEIDFDHAGSGSAQINVDRIRAVEHAEISKGSSPTNVVRHEVSGAGNNIARVSYAAQGSLDFSGPSADGYHLSSDGGSDMWGSGDFPRDQTLYRGNLIKAAGSFTLTYPGGGGAATITNNHFYNCPTTMSVVFSGSAAKYEVDLSGQDVSGIQGLIIGSVDENPDSASALVILQPAWVSTGSRVRLQLYRWSGSAYVNLAQSPPSGFSLIKVSFILI